MDIQKKEYLKLYNENEKERFLGSLKYDTSTIETFHKLLKSIGSYEELINKELYLFTTEDVINMFSYLNTSSENTITVMLSVIKKYKKWAIGQRIIPPFDEVLTLRRNEILKSISITRKKQQYIKDENELRNIVKFCVNYQDASLFILKYYGVGGDRHEEMVNLEVKDIYEKECKIIARKNDGTEREVYIPAEFIDVLLEATHEHEYMKANDMSPGMRSRSFELVITPYVLRTAYGKDATNDGKIDAQIINQRVKKIAEYYSNKTGSKDYENNREISRLNPQSITMSGLFNNLRKIEEQKGRLEKEDYDKVLNQYNVSTLLWGAYKTKYQSFKEI